MPLTATPTRRLLLVALLLLGAARFPASTRAATIIVTATAQEQPFLTNGNCTLGEAIVAANSDAPVDACPAGSGPDRITLAPGAMEVLVLVPRAAHAVRARPVPGDRGNDRTRAADRASALAAAAAGDAAGAALLRPGRS